MAMECRGSRNHSKEYMLLQVWQGTRNMENYEDMQKDVTPMRIEPREIPQRQFQYLGLIISKDGEIEVDVKDRIKSWMVEVKTYF